MSDAFAHKTCHKYPHSRKELGKNIIQRDWIKLLTVLNYKYILRISLMFPTNLSHALICQSSNIPNQQKS